MVDWASQRFEGDREPDQWCSRCVLCPHGRKHWRVLFIRQNLIVAGVCNDLGRHCRDGPCAEPERRRAVAGRLRHEHICACSLTQGPAAGGRQTGCIGNGVSNLNCPGAIRKAKANQCP